MDLQGYLCAIRKSWWIVLVAVLALSTGAYFYTKHETRIYASSLTFYVGTPSITGTTTNSTDQSAVDRATSYAQLLSTDRVGQLVVHSTHLPLSPSQVAHKISAAAQLNTVIIDVTVTDPSPKRAQLIAGAVADVFPPFAGQLDSTRTNKFPVKVTAVSGPSLSRSPVSPRTSLNVGLGFAVGLLLGLLIAVLRYLLDVSVRTADALADAGGAPVLGTVGFDSTMKSEPLLIDRLARSHRAEALRQVRTNLQFLDATQPAQVIMVTSSVEAEGKTTTACNLAIVIAETGRSVLLIEGDLRKPAAAELFGLEGSVGLSTVLSGQVALDDAFQRWGSADLHVLPSGLIPPNPSELLGGERMADLLKEVRERFDVVLIDTPPLLPVADAAVIAANADGALVVFRHSKTKRGQLQQAMQALTTIHARILGTVLNMRPMSRGERREYAGYYPSSVPKHPGQRARKHRQTRRSALASKVEQLASR